MSELESCIMTTRTTYESPSPLDLRTERSPIIRRPMHGMIRNCLDIFNVSDDIMKGSGTVIPSPWLYNNMIKPSQLPVAETERFNYSRRVDDILKEVAARAITRYVLNIVDEEHGKKYRIPVDASKKIIDVKTDMYACSDIRVSQQLWSGWPVSCISDDLMLSQLGLTEPVLELSFRVAPVSISSRLFVEKDSMEVDFFSSDDDNHFTELVMGTDYSEFTLSDDLDEYPVNSNIDSLVPQDFEDEAAASMQFAVSFRKKYGKLHPNFFTGTFCDALNKATCKSSSENKLFAVYLHHNKSILSNTFCSQLLCTKLVVQYLNEHFILWGWDVTLESNKTHFLRCLKNFLSNENSEAIMRLKDLKIDKYPVIVVFSEVPRKTFLILGHADLDELLSRLIDIVEECSVQMEQQTLRSQMSRMHL